MKMTGNERTIVNNASVKICFNKVPLKWEVILDFYQTLFLRKSVNLKFLKFPRNHGYSNLSTPSLWGV